MKPPGASASRASSNGNSSSDIALTVKDVEREFGGVHAVAGTSFQVPAREVTGLIGPNGAGKSTMVDLITGAERPTAGTIHHRGNDITGRPMHEIARRGVVRTFQLTSEFHRLTVLENLIVAAEGLRATTVWGAFRSRRYWRASEDEAVRRARGLLEHFELTELEDEYAGNLSGGQKRLVEIARALMTDPEVLLLDEPLSGVLPRLAREVEASIAGLRDRGITVLMVEHELGAVARLTDSVIVMADGRVIAEGTMEAVREDERVVSAYLGA